MIIDITPLNCECESRFKYNYDGTIVSTDAISEATIDILKLDIDKLNELRNKAIEPFIIDPITLDEISIDEAKQFAEGYLRLKNGKYNEFYTTIKYLFGNN